MKRLALVVAAAGLGLGAGLAAPARAAALVEPDDAEELAVLLAEALEEQDICYGWYVVVSDDAGSGYGGVDMGSSLGPAKRATEAPCTQYIEFEADLHYTSSSSESPDSARFRVHSNMAGAPSELHLRRVGINGSRLLGDNDDQAIADAVLALPLLAAELGLAPPIALEPYQTALPPEDGATGTPGSDFLRNNAALLSLAVIVLLSGGLWAVYGFLAGWSESKDHERHERYGEG